MTIMIADTMWEAVFYAVYMGKTFVPTTTLK